MVIAAIAIFFARVSWGAYILFFLGLLALSVALSAVQRQQGNLAWLSRLSQLRGCQMLKCKMLRLEKCGKHTILSLATLQQELSSAFLLFACLFCRHDSDSLEEHRQQTAMTHSHHCSFGLNVMSCWTAKVSQCLAYLRPSPSPCESGHALRLSDQQRANDLCLLFLC